MYDEFHVESTNSRLVGRLWVMPQGRGIIRISSHCGAREYDNVRQEDMAITVNGVSVRASVTVRLHDDGQWKVDSQYTYLDRFGASYPKKDISWAARELVEKVTRQVAASFAEKRPDKMLASELVSIERDKQGKESNLEDLIEQVSNLQGEIQMLTDQGETTRKQLTEAEDNMAKATTAGGVS